MKLQKRWVVSWTYGIVGRIHIWWKSPQTSNQTTGDVSLTVHPWPFSPLHHHNHCFQKQSPKSLFIVAIAMKSRSPPPQNIAHCTVCYQVCLQGIGLVCFIMLHQTGNRTLQSLWNRAHHHLRISPTVCYQVSLQEIGLVCFIVFHQTGNRSLQSLWNRVHHHLSYRAKLTEALSGWCTFSPVTDCCDWQMIIYWATMIMGMGKADRSTLRLIYLYYIAELQLLTVVPGNQLGPTCIVKISYFGQ